MFCSCLITGVPGEVPNVMDFQKNFDDGACLSIGWSSGRLQHFPIIYTDLSGRNIINPSYTSFWFRTLINCTLFFIIFKFYDNKIISFSNWKMQFLFNVPYDYTRIIWSFLFFFLFLEPDPKLNFNNLSDSKIMLNY